MNTEQKPSMMVDAINKTVEALRTQNVLLAQQQSIVVGLLGYWEQVQKEMLEGGMVIVQAELPEAIISPNPISADNRWQRPHHPTPVVPEQGVDMVSQVLEAPNPDPKLLAAADRLLDATKSFGKLHKTNHGRIEQPDAQVAAPTPEAAQPTAEVQQDSSIQLELKMLINQFLSPKVAMYGRGFLHPEHGTNITQYMEDVVRAPLANKATWPTGFYRDSASGAQQFMINANGLLVIVDKVDSYSELGTIEVTDIAHQWVVPDPEKAREVMKQTIINTIRWDLQSKAKPA